MPHYLCTTCGVQYAASPKPPAHCLICEDERQFVNWSGQEWTIMEALSTQHTHTIRKRETDLFAVGMQPSFALGQRALLIRTESGNILWDCISLLDAPLMRAIRELGGLFAIAISHPHFYATMVEWSQAFGGIPIYLHASDHQWVMRRDPCLMFWEGETLELEPGLTLIRCGGHFEGSSVLHWAQGAEGRGVLCTADTIQVVPDRRHVGFMYSYPNYLPLTLPAIERIGKAVEPYSFDRIYGGWMDSIIETDAKAAVTRSVERYQRFIAPLPEREQRPRSPRFPFFGGRK